MFIGYCAFYGCSGLTSIVIPDSATSIRDRTFYGCSGLTSIVISDSVTSIDYGAFYNCSSLTNVYYGGTPSEWNEISISPYNTSLTKATRYYYSESDPYEANPEDSKLYWHYVDGEVTVWIKKP